jgi:hypothetical protein
VRLPRLGDGGLLSYLLGGYRWHWTATFEAFASPFDTGDRPRATPPGEYRFVVDGRRRQGRAEVPYRIESAVFQVRPWSGVTAEDVRLEDDWTVSLRVGPRRVLDVPGEPALKAEIGPIDYPDSYGGEAKARFIREQRTAIRDPRAPSDPSKVEWYCFTCTFRPWLDTGDAETVTVTIARAGGRTETVRARREGDRWRTDAVLHPGDRARVAAGGIEDAYGNFNGAPSAEVARRPGPVPTPAPTVTPTPMPTVTPTPRPGATPPPGQATKPAPRTARPRASRPLRATARCSRRRCVVTFSRKVRGTVNGRRVNGRRVAVRPSGRRPLVLKVRERGVRTRTVFARVTSRSS